MTRTRRHADLRSSVRHGLIVFFVASLLAVPVRAQPDGGVEAGADAGPRPNGVARASSTRTATPEDDADAEMVEPGSPRESMTRFFALARSGRFDDAARYLEVDDDLDPAVTARRLALVLDRTVWVDLESLSGKASGDTRDDLPAGVEEVARIPTGDGADEPHPVRIARRTTAEGHVWRFTRATTARVDAWYEQLDGRYLLERVPPRLLREGPYHIARWQWLGLGAALLFAVLAGVVFAGLLHRIASRIARRTAATWDDDLVDTLLAPVRLARGVLAFGAALPELGLARPVAEGMDHARNVAFVLITLSAAIRLVRFAAVRLSRSTWGRTNPSSSSLVTLGARTLQVIAVVVAIIVVVASFGYDVTAIVAGLGVGGVVLALAAQKTVENLLGAFALGIDQPLREGDQVRIDGVVGVVERMGLRSTRVRTLDRHVVAFPNGKLADMPIESLTARDRMRLVTSFGVGYGTSAATIRGLRDEFERLARAHPKVYADEMHIRFAGFGESALNFEVMLWFTVTDYGSFVVAREALMLDFMTAVENAGASFAFPTRTVHLVGPRSTNTDGRDAG